MSPILRTPHISQTIWNIFRRSSPREEHFDEDHDSRLSTLDTACPNATGRLCCHRQHMSLWELVDAILGVPNRTLISMFRVYYILSTRKHQGSLSEAVLRTLLSAFYKYNLPKDMTKHKTKHRPDPCKTRLILIRQHHSNITTDLYKRNRLWCTQWHHVRLCLWQADFMPRLKQANRLSEVFKIHVDCGIGGPCRYQGLEPTNNQYMQNMPKPFTLPGSISESANFCKEVSWTPTHISC